MTLSSVSVPAVSLDSAPIDTPSIDTASSPIRTTSPRQPGSNPLSTFSALLSTVRMNGLLERHRRFYLLFAGILVVALAGCVTGFILLGDSWFQLLIAAALGLVFTQLAFLGHEASHRQVLESGRANDRIGRLVASGMVGISYSWWMNKHSRHHANPNVIGKDPDVDPDTVVFLERDAALVTGVQAWIVRRQGYLFFPLLILEGLNLHLKSMLHLFSKDKVNGRALELSMIAVRFAAYLSAIFLVLPLGMSFAFLGVQLAVFGVYMGASFAPNHKGMAIIPEGTKIDFLRKQVLTSRSIKGGWAVTMLMGGLNLQVEHHLFPSMPRPHLLRVRRLVKEHCAEEGIAYTETGLVHSYKIVVDYLNRVGLGARDPFDCPVASSYRRA